MQFPITIGLHRSSFLAVAIAAAHLAAAVVVLVPSWSTELKAASLAGVTFSAIWAWRWRRPLVDGLRLFDDGRLECRLAGGTDFLQAELLPSATVHPWLTVVPLKIDGRNKLAVVVPPDSTHPEDFRRLRIWLRWRAEFSAARDAV